VEKSWLGCEVSAQAKLWGPMCAAGAAVLDPQIRMRCLDSVAKGNPQAAALAGGAEW